MIKILTRLVIKQFLAIFCEKTKKLNIMWKRKNFKFVSRQSFDRLILEIFYEEKYNNSDMVSCPIVTIDFTNLSSTEENNIIWNSYLNGKVIELLKKIEKYDHHKIISEFSQTAEHTDFIFSNTPKMTTNDSLTQYREEFVLTYKKKSNQCNEPYLLSNKQKKSNKLDKSCCFYLQVNPSTCSQEIFDEPDIIDSIRNELELEKNKKIANSSDISCEYNHENNMHQIQTLHFPSEKTPENNMFSNQNSVKDLLDLI